MIHIHEISIKTENNSLIMGSGPVSPITTATVSIVLETSITESQKMISFGNVKDILLEALLKEKLGIGFQTFKQTYPECFI